MAGLILQISPLQERTDAPNVTQAVQGSTSRKAPEKQTSGLKEELAFPEGLFSPAPAGRAGGPRRKRLIGIGQTLGTS